jgi:hypothetical protein
MDSLVVNEAPPSRLGQGIRTNDLTNAREDSDVVAICREWEGNKAETSLKE